MRKIIFTYLFALGALTGSTSAALTHFTLVNADNNEEIQIIADGDIINLAALTTRNLNIRADVDEAPSKIVMNLSGATTRSQTEKQAPYLLWGDNSGDYKPGALTTGAHTLSGTPDSGPAYTVNFTVVDNGVGLRTVNAGPSRIVNLPVNHITLNATAFDDGSITSYAWTQRSGAHSASLSGQNTANLTASDLTVGTYVLRLTVTDNDGNSAFDEVEITVRDPANPAAEGVYLERDGLVVIEFENTESDLGKWVKKTEVSGYTGDGYLELLGSPSGSKAHSPLEFEFKIEQGGLYNLYLHCAREDVVVDGVVKHDLANDCFVRVEGDYGAGPNAGDDYKDDAPLSMLKKNTKFAGGANNKFIWTKQDRYNGEDKRVLIYDFKAGETYKLIISGRSGRFKVNRALFRHKSVSRSVAQNLSNPESERRMPTSVFSDNDSDGIDDNWEITYFGNLTTASATSDSDGDGMSDLSESKSFTSPTDASNFFAVTGFMKESEHSLTLNWKGSPEATYRIETSTDLTSWTLHTAGISGDYTDSMSIPYEETKLFVRLVQE